MRSLFCWSALVAVVSLAGCGVPGAMHIRAVEDAAEAGWRKGYSDANEYKFKDKVGWKHERKRVKALEEALEAFAIETNPERRAELNGILARIRGGEIILIGKTAEKMRENQRMAEAEEEAEANRQAKEWRRGYCEKVKGC